MEPKRPLRLQQRQQQGQQQQQSKQQEQQQGLPQPAQDQEVRHQHK